MLEFGPILAYIGFQLLKSSRSSLTYFSFNDRQMFSIGQRSGLQAGKFSTRTLLLRSHAVVIAAVCVLHCPAEIHVVWRGAYVALKPLYNFSIHSAFQTCKLPIPYALMHPIPSKMLAFDLNTDDTLECLPPL